MIVMMLPVFNQITNTWLIQNEDGSFKEISNEEYLKMFQIKTRYDGGDSGSTECSKDTKRPKATF